MRQSKRGVNPMLLKSCKLIRKLGAGSFGSVSLYEDNLTHQQYAVKEFFTKNAKSNEFISTAISEKDNFNHFIDVMKIPVEKAIVEDGKLIMPFFTGQEPNWEEIQDYLLKMYQSGFVMSDPKPNNFMHTQYGLMPIDFGAVFDVNDQEFMKNPLARNFTANAVFGYSQAFKTGSGLSATYIKLHSDELVVVDDESNGLDGEESIILMLPASVSHSPIQSTSHVAEVNIDAAPIKPGSLSPHAFFKSPRKEPAVLPVAPGLQIQVG